jgi:hypothetical protein
MRMKSFGVVVLAVIAVVLWYRHGPNTASSKGPTDKASVTASASMPSPSHGAASKPPQHATPITADQRREIADRIASAHAVHRVEAPPTLPKPTLDPNDVDTFKTTIRGAMKEVIPMLADCYDKAGSAVAPEITVRANLVLTGDPDVGTLIDAKELTDPNGGTFDKGFDDCIRSTLQSVELPPLAEGDEVHVTYPFVFRRE